MVAAPLQARCLAIVMDDVGYNVDRAQRVIDLPGPVTLGMLPFAPATLEIALRAQIAGRELILHQPMEPIPTPHARWAQGTLTLNMAPDQFNALTDAAVRAIPGISSTSIMPLATRRSGRSGGAALGWWTHMNWTLRSRK